MLENCGLGFQIFEIGSQGNCCSSTLSGYKWYILCATGSVCVYGIYISCSFLIRIPVYRTLAGSVCGSRGMLFSSNYGENQSVCHSIKHLYNCEVMAILLLPCTTGTVRQEQRQNFKIWGSIT